MSVRVLMLGIAKIIEGLNEVLSQEYPVRIALETMAGKGTEIGRNFDEIASNYRRRDT